MGQWRRTVPNVGAYVPPAAARVPQLLYEWADEVCYRQRQLPLEPTVAQVAELLAYAHYRLVAIHPFTNGNGRTARLVTNLLAYSYGYQAACRNLAQEVLVRAIAHGRLVPGPLGRALGQQLAARYVPVPRLTANLAALRGVDATTDEALRQVVDQLLPELPGAPLRNLRPLLDFYADLVARTRPPVPPAVRALLQAWRATPPPA